MNGPSMADAALDYAVGAVFGRAVSVFPVRRDKKRPYTRNGFDNASTDLEQICEWWADWPDANVGLPLQDNGLCAVDLDGPVGLSIWSELGADHPGPVTCCTETGGGGGHLIYALPAGRKPRGTVGVFPNIDLRGRGYLVAPPSVHENGTIYRWVVPPTRLAPQPAPDWILEPLKAKREVVVRRYEQTDGHTRYGRAALIGLATEVESAPVGQRNHTLYRASRRVLELVDARDLEYRKAWDILRLAAGDCGLGEREIDTTLASAEGGHRGAA